MGEEESFENYAKKVRIMQKSYYEQSQDSNTTATLAKQIKTEIKEELPSVGDPGNNQLIPWYCKVRFDCPICFAKFWDAKEMFTHPSSAHTVSREDLIDQYNLSDVLPKLEHYSCKICNMEVKYQKSSISNHLSSKHSMDISLYENMYHALNQLPRQSTSN